MRLIDTHCHLVSEKLNNDFIQILERARLAGVEKVINISYDWQSVMLALEQNRKAPNLYTALGIQPHDAHSFTLEVGEKIKNLIKQNKQVIAVGEIGMDAYYSLSSMDKQIECFEYFLQTALELNLPVVIHVRNTHSEVYPRLLKFSKLGLRGVIHCFTGSLEEAKQFLDCGYYISFSGIVTFKNAKEVQEVAKFIPSEKILIETDSPYLSPTPLRGRVNEPAHLIYVNEFLANLRNENVESFAEQTYQNALNLFRI
jgi:TatD DNase family protein